MPLPRPLLAASAVTAIAAALAITLSGGHSPFETAVAVAQPLAELAAATPEPTADAIAVVAAEDPATATPDATRRPSKSHAAPTAKPRPAGTGASRGTGTGAAPTPGPTSKPKPKPTPRPTPKPTPKPTPAPAQGSGALAVDVRNGNPVLSWTECTSGSFAAYAVVRSSDSEIHFPAEDRDTVVAMVTERGSTRLTDGNAPAGAKAWYRVWCVSRNDGEYKTIWRTPTVSVTP